MGYEAEVGQGALNPRLHDGGRSRVSEGRPVLSEQVGELLANLPRKQHRQISRRELSANCHQRTKPDMKSVTISTCARDAQVVFKSQSSRQDTYLAARSMFLRELTSLRSTCGLPRYSAMAFAGNSVSQT